MRFTAAIIREPDERSDRYGESASFAGVGDDGYVAAVKLGDMFHDRQPQPRSAFFAASGLVDAVETLEDARLVFFLDSDSVVGHRESRSASDILERKFDRKRAGIAKGILYEIEQGLFDERRVAGRFDAFVFKQHQTDARRGGVGLHQRENVFQDIRKVAHGERALRFAARMLDPRQSENILGELVESDRFVFENLEHCRAIGFGQVFRVAEKFYRAENSRERSAYLVRKIRNEIAPEFLELAHFVYKFFFRVAFADKLRDSRARSAGKAVNEHRRQCAERGGGEKT